jgi:hypothetical protein
LPKFNEQAAAATRAYLGGESFAGRLGSIDIEAAGPTHNVPAAQVLEHTIS